MDAFSVLMAPQSAESASTLAPACAAGRKRRRAASPSAQQLSLDCGQRLLGVRVCPDCRCVYQQGAAQDEALHRQRHDVHVHGLPFRGWAVEPRVWPERAPSAASAALLPAGHRMLAVRAPHLSAHPHRVEKTRELLALLQHHLGAAVGEPRSMPARAPLGADEALLIYVAQQRVVGLLLARGSVRCSLLLQASDGCWRLSVDDAERCTAPLGVERVWVLPGWRRRGIATLLLDAARCSLPYGEAVSRDYVAFSQPTDDGRRFAQSYTGKQRCRAYA